MAFLNLPPIPASVSPVLRDQMETYRTQYFAEDEAGYKSAYAIADTLVGFEPVSAADLAAKLMLALHHLAPGNQHEALFQIDPSDITSVVAERLLVACVIDAIRLAERAEWDRNLVTYRAAHETYLRSLDLLTVSETHLDSDSPSAKAIEAHNNAAMDVEVEAEKRLLSTPAPDLQAALIKAQILEESHAERVGMKALLADLARLDAAAA